MRWVKSESPFSLGQKVLEADPVYFTSSEQGCLISITWVLWNRANLSGRQYPPPIPFYPRFRHSHPIHLSPLLNVFSFPGKQSFCVLWFITQSEAKSPKPQMQVSGVTQPAQRLQNKGSPSAFQAVKCQAWLERSLVLTALCASRRAAFLLGMFLIVLPVVGCRLLAIL